MIWLVHGGIFLANLGLLLWLVFLLVLAVASLTGRQRPALSRTPQKLAVLIPAHNEAGMVGRTVTSIKGCHYPPDCLRVVVVADNCTDETATEARAAGAESLVRSDDRRQGKGYALRFGLAALMENPWDFDAVVFLDADAAVAPDFLRRMSANLASGQTIIQGCYTVSEPERTWFTRLTHLGFVLKNHFQYPGLNRLGLSVPLRGSGMCFSRDVLAAQGWGSVSLTEDLDFSIKLITQGYRIHFDRGARCWHYMPPTLPAAMSQRSRWSQGAAAAGRDQLRPFLREALGKRNWPGVLQALYLLAPPLSSLLLASLALNAAALVAGGQLPGLGLIVSGLYTAYFLLALTVTGCSRGYLAALLMILVYAPWRAGIHILARFTGTTTGKTWIKTPRV